MTKPMTKEADIVNGNPFADQRVDIIIPYHGKYHLVKKLVESIVRVTRSNPYIIILVDDGSPQKEFHERMRDAPQTVSLRLEEQKGFGAALQAGFEVSKQLIPGVVIKEKKIVVPPRYVCFMNSDCLVQNPNWLLEMGSTLIHLKSQGVKLVSACSDNPCGNPNMTVERGAAIETYISDEALPLFCCLCHHELFRRIGGFIKNYPYGGYEDEELFWRMKKYGYKQAVCGKSWIHHEGEATIKTLWDKSSKIKRIMLEENRNRCLQDIQSL